MKALSDVELNIVFTKIKAMFYHKMNLFSSWSDFVDMKGIYVTRAEIIAMWRICHDIGINVEIEELPAMVMLEEEDYIFPGDEQLFDLENAITEFVFFNNEIMEKCGWEETEVRFNEDSFQYDENDEEFHGMDETEIMQKLSERIFHEYADALPKELSYYLELIKDDQFVPDLSYLVKSKRVGRFYEYVEHNKKVKRTRLYKQIEFCVNTITQPFYYYFTDISDKVLKDGCIYAFITSGYFSETDSGEFISLVHSKLCRRFCVEVLDLLLTKAEKKYIYNCKGVS